MIARTQKEVAAALGVNVRTFRGWLRDPRWRLTTSAPWDTDAVAEWVKSVNKGRDSEASSLDTDIKKARLAKTIAETLRIRGAYVRREQYLHDLEAMADLFCSGIDECELTMPVAHAGKTPAELEILCKTRFDALRLSIRNRARESAEADAAQLRRRRGAPHGEDRGR
jgi:hypothetical protein